MAICYTNIRFYVWTTEIQAESKTSMCTKNQSPSNVSTIHGFNNPWIALDYKLTWIAWNSKMGKMFRLPNSSRSNPPLLELPIPNWRMEVESDPWKDIYDTMSELILPFRYLAVMKIRFPDINLSCLVCNIPALSMYSRTKTHWHT